MGPPFTSRQRDPHLGLSYNPHFTHFPFVCERCTVQATIRRALVPHIRDIQLMILERMRMIDCSHAWAPGTTRSAQNSIRRLFSFLDQHEISTHLLEPPQVSLVPPHGSSVLLLWAMESYTLQVSTNPNHGHVTFNSARSLRSGLHLYLSWCGNFLPEGSSYRDKDRLHTDTGVGATGSVLVQLTTAGMARRLGTESNPSVALQAQHIRTNISLRTRLIATSPDGSARSSQLKLAQLAELLAWTGWLRAQELFSLRWCDIQHVPPSTQPGYGLPPHTGALLLRLLPSTKTSPTRTADHIVAHQTSSGLRVGYWFLQAKAAQPPTTQPTDYVFRTPKGTQWTSRWFRTEFVYPLLHQQWLQEDPLLRTYANRDPNLIPTKFYSLSSYRRGGRTHVSRKRDGCTRKATSTEIEDHGRWRSRGKTASNMPLHYRESSFEDKLYITLLCM